MDIKLDSVFGDISIQNGDLVLWNEDAGQNQADIINDFKGEWKKYPNIGIGIKKYLNGPVNNVKLQQEIKMQLQSDGFIVSNVRVNFSYGNSTLTITPNAKRAGL